ncbi:hypothetical protein B7Z17_05045, partial [Candidatus Saccharibacteria bacterium 32-49-10]
MNQNGITQPKSHGWLVFIAVIAIGVLGFFGAGAYNHFVVSGGPAEDKESPATVNSTLPSAVNLTPTRTPTPTPVEYFDEDTARDLCWGDSLPGVQTSVPSGMSVYDGLGSDAGARVCMTPGEYTRYQAAATKQLAAEQVVRGYVGQYTADDAPKSIRAAAAVAYLCALDAPSDLQYSAVRAVFAELAGQSTSFSTIRDAMCGNHSRPTAPPPSCEGKECQMVPMPPLDRY